MAMDEWAKSGADIDDVKATIYSSVTMSSYDVVGQLSIDVRSSTPQ